MTPTEIKESFAIFQSWLLQEEQVTFQEQTRSNLKEMFDIFWEEYNSD